MMMMMMMMISKEKSTPNIKTPTLDPDRETVTQGKAPIQQQQQQQEQGEQTWEFTELNGDEFEVLVKEGALDTLLDPNGETVPQEQYPNTTTR